MTETERVNEIIRMLETIDAQVKPMGRHCKIDNLEADTVHWMIGESINALGYLNRIRWDDTELFKGGIDDGKG